MKKKALQRIKIASGHLAKVEKMLQEDAYCLDVIHQSRAVQAALKKIDELILDGHLHSCVFEDIKGNSEDKERIIEEIVDLFEKKP